MTRLSKLGACALFVVAAALAFPVPAMAITYIPEQTMTALEGILPYALLPAISCLIILLFLHARYLLGTKNALKFFIYGYIIAWIFEDISVHTGLIFGLYYFPDMMGPKLDVIPFAIPMLWIMCFYTSWYLTNLLLDGSPIQTNFSTGRNLAGAFIGAFILTSMDLTTDPFATANGFWIWPNGGTFFGEPIHNFVGWYLTGAFTFFVHALIMKKDIAKDPIVLNSSRKRKWTIAMIIFYGCFWITYTFMNVHQSLGVPTFFAMGLPTALALWKWVCWYRETKKQEALPNGASVSLAE